jgi:hypothetical protein
VNASRELLWEDHVAILRQADSSLAEAVGDFTSIKSVLEWMKNQGLAQARIDIIGQDEFHDDFLIELEQGGRWIAFGVT